MTVFTDNFFSIIRQPARQQLCFHTLPEPEKVTAPIRKTTSTFWDFFFDSCNLHGLYTKTLSNEVSWPTSFWSFGGYYNKHLRPKNPSIVAPNTKNRGLLDFGHPLLVFQLSGIGKLQHCRDARQQKTWDFGDCWWRSWNTSEQRPVGFLKPPKNLGVFWKKTKPVKGDSERNVCEHMCNFLKRFFVLQSSKARMHPSYDMYTSIACMMRVLNTYAFFWYTYCKWFSKKWFYYIYIYIHIYICIHTHNISIWW